jgi:N6-L-threonylcarbamoyladenine synthase
MNNKQKLIILGIETSCDETAAAVLKYHKKNNSFEIISNVVASQISLHQKYGGIVPEIAARAHIENILPVIKKSLKPKGRKNDYSLKEIDLIAVTQGPGLITSLLVGVETAKTMAYSFKKPLMGINHLEGHLAANFINHPHIPYPAISLIVSGGHTELGLIKKQGHYKKIGQTRDDAAGECFDKIAKLLDLGYPGGPIISQMAKKVKTKSKNIKFPRPMINSDDFDFSFSGLKTAVFYLIKNNKSRLKDIKFVQNVCLESQQAIIDVLIKKTIRASRKYQAKTIMLSGGVAANQELRNQLKIKIAKTDSSLKFLVPEIKYCTDNAVMIAAAAGLKYNHLNQKLSYTKGLQKDKQKNQLKNNWQKLKPNPNLNI